MSICTVLCVKPISGCPAQLNEGPGWDHENS